MTFRRQSTDSIGHSRWRLAHRAELLECGVPMEVLESDRNWIYVLHHGSDEFGTGWNPTWISKEQAGKLLEIVKTKISNPIGYDIIRDLEKRIESAS